MSDEESVGGREKGMMNVQIILVPGQNYWGFAR